jgi:hypothetical protein
MLEWLTGKKKHKDELPAYSRLKLTPMCGIPPELAGSEASEFFETRRDARQHELLEPAVRPADDEPLFTELVGTEDETFVTITLPDDSGGCLPVFSSPLRAGDYVQTLLPEGPSVRYLRSTPRELAEMRPAVEEAGVKAFTLNRCPRCDTFGAVGSGSVRTADDLLAVWAVFKATELERANLYFAFALVSARAGWLEDARDVALETVGHVTLEDPRPHLLLGQLGVGLGDRRLVREAKAFLRFLGVDGWERKLDLAVRSGSPDFAFDFSYTSLPDGPLHD